MKICYILIQVGSGSIPYFEITKLLCNLYLLVCRYLYQKSFQYTAPLLNSQRILSNT